MKISLFASAICSMTLCGTMLLAGPRDEDWKQVNQQLEGDLPKSALETLQKIETAARGESAWAEVAKAVGFRVLAETQIEGGHPEEKIRRFERELALAPTEIVPVLQTLQATAYWEYFEQNRWRILARTRTSEKPGDDFETSTRVQLRGRYESGIAGIQCLYAPEFNSHSSSFPLEVE